MSHKIKNYLLKDCAEYWDSLSHEDKDWLYRFELAEKMVMVKKGESPLSFEDRQRIISNRNAKDNCILNNSPEAVLKHYYDKQRKPAYGPQDYGLVSKPESK